MKFMFVQKRYHTNRHPMVKALKQNGHKVEFISIVSHTQEAYEVIEPCVLGYSPAFDILSTVFGHSENEKQMKGWPPIIGLWREMKTFDPDIVLVRDYTVRSAIPLIFANMLGGSGIIQEQWPKYLDSLSIKKRAVDTAYKLVCKEPLLRVTPIEGTPADGQTSPNVYYVPFVVDPDLYDPETASDNAAVNIISVGKFKSERKNHIGLLRAFNKLREEFDIFLTLVGSLENQANENYKRIRSYIRENNLDDTVDIKTNMEYEELQTEYSRHDLFVLPSRNEPAAVSHLEAMAAGVPVICSDTNGTKGYVIEGKNGYIFRSESQWDLEHTLRTAVADPDKLQEMGQFALDYIEENHSPAVFCDSIERIVEDNFTP